MNLSHFYEISSLCKGYGAKLIAVSKFQAIDDIHELYKAGQRDFAENRVQALIERKEQLSPDIQWHMIGNLQRNKVKYIAPFISMIHSVDSLELLTEIDKQAKICQRIIPILFEVKIAKEESKHGFSRDQLLSLFKNNTFNILHNIQISGLMGMASLTEDAAQINNEFASLKSFFDLIKKEFITSDNFCELSMGMSADFSLALQHGSTMIRVGSKLFQS